MERCLLIVTGYPTARSQHITKKHNRIRIHARSIVPIFAYGDMIEKSPYVIVPTASTICWSVANLRVRDQEDVGWVGRLERPIRVGF